jgi:hypothetical protein
MSTPGGKSRQRGRNFARRLSAIRQEFIGAFGNRLPTWQVWLLRLTLVVDGLVAIGLAWLELKLTTTLMESLGVGLLLAIGLANLFALHSVARALPSWPRDVAFAQLLVALLAIYIVFTAPRCWGQNRWMLGITAAAGLLAVGWVLRIARGAVLVQWTKPAAIIAAVIPVAGLVQFWLQTEYIPHSTTPLVDISAELTPTGRTESTIHLSAKVTIRNRASVRLENPAGLMRVTEYPKNWQQRSPSPCSTDTPNVDPAGNILSTSLTLVGGLDPTSANPDGEFRLPATPVSQCVLVYASVFGGGPGAFINPGATQITQKEIDIDADTFRLARLSVSGVFVTEHRFQDVRACYPTKDTAGSLNPQHWPIQASLYDQNNSDKFYTEAENPWPGQFQTQNLCVDYELTPKSILQALMSGPQSVLRVEVVTSQQGDSVNEYPQLRWWYGTTEDIDKSPPHEEQEKIERAYPESGQVDVAAEYAPGEPLRSDRHASAPASGPAE